MKTGRFIYEPTGEIRPPKKGEYYTWEGDSFPTKAAFDFNKDGLDYTIYRLIEEDTVWKPKDIGERYYYVDLSATDYFVDWGVYNNDATDNQLFSLGLMFPNTDEGKELAIKKAEEIISLIKNNQK